MTDACGFPVQATIDATGIDRSFETWPGGLIYLGTQRTNVILSAGDNTVAFHERGQESVRANRDGTFTVSYTGRSSARAPSDASLST